MRNSYGFDRILFVKTTFLSVKEPNTPPLVDKCFKYYPARGGMVNGLYRLRPVINRLLRNYVSDSIYHTRLQQSVRITRGDREDIRRS